MFIIMCRVSGGVTGTREAPLKKNGVVETFDTREAAEAVAKELNRRPHQFSTAYFKYLGRRTRIVVEWRHHEEETFRSVCATTRQ